MLFINLLLILILLSFINSDETPEPEEKIYCSLNAGCDDCEYCTDYSTCNYSNIFCYQNSSKDYNRNEQLQNDLGAYFKRDSNMQNFCNSRSISLNSPEDSFNLFELPSNPNNVISSKSYHCEYFINNKYYFRHDTDQAKITLEISKKNSGNLGISFFLLFIYQSDGYWRFFRFTDDQLRSASFSRVLDQISEIEILIDFYGIDTPGQISESLVMSITTDNPSENMRVIYIVIIVILCVFVLVVIALFVIYYCLKKKMRAEEERRIIEEQEKNEKDKKLVEEFMKSELSSQVFSEKININDCDSCTICCENFIVGESQVSITPCSHVFHHDCITKWVNEKINNPHCPNCNFQFLEYIKNPDKVKIHKKEKLNDENNKENKRESENLKITNVYLNNEGIMNHNNNTILSENLRINPPRIEENNEDEKSININNEDNEESNNKNNHENNNII